MRFTINNILFTPAPWSLPFLLLLLSVSHAQDDVQTPQQGPGDVRDGYESSDFRTRSVSLQARRGQEADLVANLETPPLGLPVVPEV